MMIIFFFKQRLVSGTRQLILLTLFIIRPVSSDQTDFTRDLTGRIINKFKQKNIKKKNKKQLNKKKLQLKPSLFSIDERCAGSAQVTGTTSQVPVLDLLGQNSDFYLFANKTHGKT